MNIALPKRLTVDEFLAWAARQTEGKYEFVDGAVIMQQAQNWGHSRVKFEVALALREAIRAAEVACYVASDGPTVRISKHKAFVPDALVAPLPEPAFDSLEITNPIIVVEVLSPSTVRLDTTTKLDGYFKISNVKRAAAVKTRIVRKGGLALNPPGIEIRPSDLFAPAG